MYDGYVIIGTKLDTSGFEDGLDGMEKKSKLQQFIESIQEKLSSMLNNTGKSLKNIGKNLKGIGKTILQVGSLAIRTMAKVLLNAVGFGIAFTAALGAIGAIILGLMVVAGAMKKVMEDNKQAKTDLQYIIFAIKTALEPAIEWLAEKIGNIIKKMIEILKYAMAIANYVAGRNLFEKADAKAFADYMKKSEKSSGKTAKNAASIRKQLAGFDEMNILQDNVSGGTNKDEMPSFDASDLADIQKNVDETIGKYRQMWTTISNINRTEAKNAFLGQNDPWGLLKLGGFDVVQGLMKQFEGLGKTIQGVGKIVKGLVTGDFGLFGSGVSDIVGGIVKAFKGLGQTILGIFESIVGAGAGLGRKLKEVLNSVGVKFETVFAKAMTIGNNIAKGLKETLGKSLWKTIGNFFIDVMNTVIANINKKFSFSISENTANLLKGLGVKNVEKGQYQIIKIPSIPRLAQGGVINLPGRGVAIGGESGPEGVIPLTDTQQMELLGEAIGRYITVNANITNSMNGRVLSRELQKIQNQNSFASNR